MRGYLTPETKEERLQVRKTFIPKKKGAVKISPKGVDAEIYIYEEQRGGKTVYLAIGFAGTAGKPTFHHNYRSLKHRDEHLAQFINGLKKHAEAKKAKSEQKKAAQHNWTVGMILDGSWGYDQTNVEFFEVTEVTGKCQVTIRELKQKDAGTTGDMSGYVLPVPGEYVGEPVKKNVQSYNGGNFYVSFKCFTLSPWNGQKRHQTSYA